MSFKKNPTTEELKMEVETLQSQLVVMNNQNLALKKQINNNPAVIELAALKSKWFVKLFNWK